MVITITRLIIMTVKVNSKIIRMRRIIKEINKTIDIVSQTAGNEDNIKVK